MEIENFGIALLYVVGHSQLRWDKEQIRDIQGFTICLIKSWLGLIDDFDKIMVFKRTEDSNTCMYGEKRWPDGPFLPIFPLYIMYIVLSMIFKKNPLISQNRI